MTIKDIAKEAGVAVSTVSLVLNCKPGVGLETRRRITQLLEKNGYSIRKKPDAFVKQGNLTFIRFLAENHLNERNGDFFSCILNGAEKYSRDSGYTLSLMNVTSSQFEFRLSQLERQDTDGIILLASELDSKGAALLSNHRIPVIAIDTPIDYLPISSINSDDKGGAYAAVSYLYSLGHRSIGFLQGAVEIGGLSGRTEGFYQAMNDLSLPVREEHVIKIDLLFDDATRQMKQYLASARSLPTAFFAGNDIIAAGCQRALIESGLRVPEDISIIGFDDGAMSTFVTPALTTMRVEREYIGMLAVQQLISAINGNTHITKTRVGVTLTERASTAAPQR